MIIVDGGTPGLEIVRDIPVMGDSLGGHAELYFRDCRVPRQNGRRPIRPTITTTEGPPARP